MWYTGIFGNILFFAYCFAMARKRRQAIEQFQLIEKIQANGCLGMKDREVVVYLLSSLS